MSTIYSLPTTIIQTNGSRIYRIKTKDYDGVLQHVEVESKTNDTINLNFEDLYFESIAFKGGSDLGETTLKCIRETKDVKNYYTVDSRPITCDESLKDEYLAELQFLVMRGYVIDIPVPVFKDITLDLNNAWRRCQTYDSPLEGWTLYESASNWHVGGASAICYLNIISNDVPLVMYYCSYAENQFDWLNIGFPDGTGVDTLRTPQQPPASIGRMAIIEKDATMTGVCTITYRKDGSVDSGNDRGYILIPNDIPFINEYVEPVPEPVYIDMISIAGPSSITDAGTYDFQAGIIPLNADTYNLGWYIDEAPTGVVARIRWNADDTKHAYLEIDSIDEGVDSELTIVCYDDVSGVQATYTINVKKEREPIHIQNITISGPSQITEPGTYNYYATISPSDADEYDIDWDTIGFTDPHWYLQTDPEDPFHAQIVVPKTESFGSAFYLRCEDNVSFNYDRFSISMDVYVEPPVPADGPLCFTARSSAVDMTIPLDALTNPMISTDGVNWLTAPSEYTIPANESVYMKADSCNSSYTTNKYFNFSETVDASGNIMSLTGDINKLNMTGNSFKSLFENCGLLKTAPKLPATKLSRDCYASMFYNTGLVEAPELPATQLEYGCYFGMFSLCTSLTTPPSILPATTLKSWCYGQMFYTCSSLKTAPVLPATTLIDHCYDSMFGRCTSLTTAPELPATQLENACYKNMFERCSKLNYIKTGIENWDETQTTSWLSGVSSTGTFYKKTGVNIPVGVNGIPSGWTVVEY